MSTVEPITAWAATRRALADAMAHIDGLLPGSVVRRHMRCGKAGCACTADPPTLHGPYIQWTRTVNGKTATRYLSEEQLARYQPWFDNSRLLKDIIAKLEIASLHAVEQSERHPGKPTSASATAAKGHSTRLRAPNSSSTHFHHTITNTNRLVNGHDQRHALVPPAEPHPNKTG